MSATYWHREIFFKNMIAYLGFHAGFCGTINCKCSAYYVLGEDNTRIHIARRVLALQQTACGLYNHMKHLKMEIGWNI